MDNDFVNVYFNIGYKNAQKGKKIIIYIFLYFYTYFYAQS